MTIYLLTLVDNLRSIAIIGMFVWPISALAVGLLTEESEEVRKHMKKHAWWSVLAVLILGFVPGSSQLRDAYVTVELSKVGTAENAKLVAERIEVILKAFAEKK